MPESGFDDEEIKQEFRKSASNKKNLDYDLFAKKRELLVLARNAPPEEFKAKLTHYGIEPGSTQEAEAMRMYWLLTRSREPSR